MVFQHMQAGGQRFGYGGGGGGGGGERREHSQAVSMASYLNKRVKGGGAFWVSGVAVAVAGARVVFQHMRARGQRFGVGCGEFAPSLLFTLMLLMANFANTN